MLKRKILALLLCVCMAVTVLPVTALAVAEEVTVGLVDDLTDNVVIEKTYDGVTNLTDAEITEVKKKLKFTKEGDANPVEVSADKYDVTGVFTNTGAGTQELTLKVSIADTATGEFTLAGAEDGSVEIKAKGTINKATLAIALKSETLSLEAGKTDKVEVNEPKTGVTYTYSSSDEDVATVDSTGQVTAKKVGTANITVSVADANKANYDVTDKKCAVTVTAAARPAANKLTAKVTKNSIAIGETTTVSVTGTQLTGDTVTYTSSDSAVAKVEGTTVTGLTAGTATITATVSNANYKSDTSTITITVTKTPVTLNLSASTEEGTEEVEGEEVKFLNVTLTVNGQPEGKTVTLTCDNGITPTQEGDKWTAKLTDLTTEYTFTATYAGDDTYAKAEAKCTVKGDGTTAHVHTPAETWTSDANEHWHACAGCTEKLDKAAHVYTDNADTTCDTCGYTRTVSSGGDDPTPPVVTPPSGGGTTTPDTPATPEVAPSTTVSGSTANATVSSSQGSGLVEAAKNPGTSEVTVKVETDEDVTEANVTLPASAVKGVGDNKADLTITTPVADVTLPSEALTGLGSGASNVTVSAAINDDQSVSVTVKKDSTTVETLAQPMKVTVGVEDLTDTTVAYLVNADGTETIIKKSIAREDEMDVLLKGSAKVVFKENEKSFNDISGHWASSSIGFATSHELFQGTGEGVFSPEVTMTRGMIVTVLHRLEDTPQGANASFGDVGSGSYCAEAVAWGSEKGIVLGAGGNSFNPDGEVTRQDLATFLYRYAGKYGVDITGRTNLSSFPDAGAVNSYAKDALEWAFNAGLIKGGDDGRLDPAGKATRAQVAAILQRFVSYINK